MNGMPIEDAGPQGGLPDVIGAALGGGTRGFVPKHGLNPLVSAAHPLLESAVRLRQAQVPLPLAPLRGTLIEQVDAFVDEGARAGIGTEALAAARYYLCTFVDEIIAATPWGGGGAWASRSLLVSFHGEASGGERFFTILHRLSQEPAANIDVLELLSLILALGMEGRYRLVEGGSAELQRVREKLRQLIRAERGAPEHALSPRWQGMSGPHHRPRRVIGVLSGTLVGSAIALAVLFAGLDYRLRLQAEPVMSELAQIRISRYAAPSDATLRAASAPEIADLLAPDIAAHLLTVDAGEERAVITLRSDGLFASGSARVLPGHVPLIRRIGAALREVPGRVIVVGHTDNQATSPGNPSNWQLSLARASQVVEMLREEAGHPERFLAQGRGELDPVAPNDSAANQARNRRVVITVLAPGASL